ncbi:MAG: AMP-binding protein, partial [Terriglobus roseus]|nr:AMP-binding protein [Terriglobus roseus]
PAFINCNLTAAPLIHSAKLCDTRYLITDTAQRPLVQPCENELATDGIETLYFDEDFFKTLTDTTPLPESRRKNIDPQALSCLIYTSGTTGMPKGTILNRGKEINLTRATAEYLGLKPGSRMYTCLPLYHGAAHGLCFVPMIGGGGTVILSRKFSHKTFWPEVRASKANIVQYVGELCRYLINAPPSPLDKAHSVEMAWGNGMRPDVWEVFRERFGIECINELYAATDGLGSSFNPNRGAFSRNAIGVRGAYWHYMNGANEKRVYIDPDSQEILKNEQGFATECKVGDAGEVLHKLDPNAPVPAFSGYYKNKAAGEKRIIRDVFEKGDMWFRSGDMMRLEVSSSSPKSRPLSLSSPSSSLTRGSLNNTNPPCSYYTVQRRALLLRPARRHLPVAQRKRLDLRSRRRSRLAPPDRRIQRLRRPGPAQRRTRRLRRRRPDPRNAAREDGLGGPSGLLPESDAEVRGADLDQGDAGAGVYGDDEVAEGAVEGGGGGAGGDQGGRGEEGRGAGFVVLVAAWG